MNEVWKPIQGYENCYEVSNIGRVRSMARQIKSKNRWGSITLNWPEKILTLLENQDGYYKVLLSKKGKTENKLVSTLVAEAFIGVRPKGLFVLHNDGDQKNNCITNLRYGTQRDNMLDSIKHGTRPKGIVHKCAKLTEKQVREIRTSDKTNIALAKKFGVDPSTVRLARIGKSWKHL